MNSKLITEYFFRVFVSTKIPLPVDKPRMKPQFSTKTALPVEKAGMGINLSMKMAVPVEKTDYSSIASPSRSLSSLMFWIEVT